MIKPSDIPEDIADLAYKIADISTEQGMVIIADILNAAIEAGIVSPPCYVVRNESTGELVRHQILDHVGNPVLMQGIPFRKNHEHWKGQTE